VLSCDPERFVLHLEPTRRCCNIAVAHGEKSNVPLIFRKNVASPRPKMVSTPEGIAAQVVRYPGDQPNISERTKSCAGISDTSNGLFEPVEVLCNIVDIHFGK
jgi:hypothetical protein